MAKKPSRKDPHRDIPKDADGNPIFVILPDGYRRTYDRAMARCERAWLATRDPLAVDEAMKWAFAYRQPPSRWLHEAVEQLAHKQRTKDDANRAVSRAKKAMRHQAVRDARWPDGRSKPHKLSFEKSYDRASEVLAGTMAPGEPETMKKHYGDVARDLREGRGGLYHMIKKRRDKPAPTAKEIAAKQAAQTLSATGNEVAHQHEMVGRAEAAKTSSGGRKRPTGDILIKAWRTRMTFIWAQASRETKQQFIERLVKTYDLSVALPWRTASSA